MKKTILIGLLSLFCAFSLNAQKEENDNTIIENKNKPEREEWLRDLGFGMFYPLEFG